MEFNKTRWSCPWNSDQTVHKILPGSGGGQEDRGGRGQGGRGGRIEGGGGQGVGGGRVGVVGSRGGEI